MFILFYFSPLFKTLHWTHLFDTDKNHYAFLHPCMCTDIHINTYRTKTMKNNSLPSPFGGWSFKKNHKLLSLLDTISIQHSLVKVGKKGNGPFQEVSVGETVSDRSQILHPDLEVSPFLLCVKSIQFHFDFSSADEQMIYIKIVQKPTRKLATEQPVGKNLQSEEIV